MRRFKQIAMIMPTANGGTGGGDTSYNVEYIVGEEIPKEQFEHNTNIKKINFPNVTKIGVEAFNYCEGLTNVNIPNVIEIDNAAFNYCSSVVNFDFPNATKIGDSVFANCEKLTNVNLPKITSIGNSAFSRCGNLEKVDFSNITSIGMYAFNECRALTSVILRTPQMCAFDLTSFENSAVMITLQCIAAGESFNEFCGFVYVPNEIINTYITVTNMALESSGMPIDSALLFRKIEDYPEICG